MDGAHNCQPPLEQQERARARANEIEPAGQAGQALVLRTVRKDHHATKGVK
jgi:hypothetical protein